MCGESAVNEGNTYICVCIHTYICTCVRTYIHTYICMYVHTYIHRYIKTYKHTYIHAYIHTGMHTYIPWIHKCVTKTVGCRTSHKFTNIHSFYSVKYLSICIFICCIRCAGKSLLWAITIIFLHSCLVACSEMGIVIILLM